MKSISKKAYGKLNIGLEIKGKRPDGFHDLKMVMQTVGVYDTVTVTAYSSSEDAYSEIDFIKNPESKNKINIQSNITAVPADKYNLCYKVCDWIMNEYRVSDAIQIKIDKILPVAAGMAGGSSDAAATIEALDELYGLSMLQSKKDEIGLMAGSDVPFCLRCGTYLAEGRGEVLTKILPMPSLHVLIVRPMFGVSTKWAYESYDKESAHKHVDVDALFRAICKGEPQEIAKYMGNSLEQTVIKEHPVVGKIKSELLEGGALASLMSGSGPTVYALFDDEAKAKAAYSEFCNKGEKVRCFLTGFINALL